MLSVPWNFAKLCLCRELPRWQHLTLCVGHPLWAWHSARHINAFMTALNKRLHGLFRELLNLWVRLRNKGDTEQHHLTRGTHECFQNGSESPWLSAVWAGRNQCWESEGMEIFRIQSSQGVSLLLRVNSGLMLVKSVSEGLLQRWQDLA